MSNNNALTETKFLNLVAKMEESQTFSMEDLQKNFEKLTKFVDLKAGTLRRLKINYTMLVYDFYRKLKKKDEIKQKFEQNEFIAEILCLRSKRHAAYYLQLWRIEQSTGDKIQDTESIRDFVKKYQTVKDANNKTVTKNGHSTYELKPEKNEEENEETMIDINSLNPHDRLEILVLRKNEWQDQIKEINSKIDKLEEQKEESQKWIKEIDSQIAATKNEIKDISEHIEESEDSRKAA